MSTLLIGQSVSDYLVLPITGKSYLPGKNNFSIDMSFKLGQFSEQFDYSGDRESILALSGVTDLSFSQLDLLTTLAYGFSNKSGLRVLLPYRMNSSLDYTVSAMGFENDVSIPGITGLGDVKVGLWHLYKQDQRESSFIYTWFTLPTGKSESDLNDEEHSPTGDGIYSLTAGWGSDYLVNNPLGLLVSPHFDYTIHSKSDVYQGSDTLSQENGGLFSLELPLSATPISLNFSGGLLELGLGVAYAYNWKGSTVVDDEVLENTDASQHFLNLGLGFAYRKAGLGNIFLNFKKPLVVGGYNQVIPEEWGIELRYQPRSTPKSTKLQRRKSSGAVEQGKKPRIIRPSILDEKKSKGLGSKKETWAARSSKNRPEKEKAPAYDPEKTKNSRLVNVSDPNEKYEDFARSYVTEGKAIEPVSTREVKVERTPTAATENQTPATGEQAGIQEAALDDSEALSTPSMVSEPAAPAEPEGPYTTISGAPDFDYSAYGELPRYKNTDLNGAPRKPKLIYDKWHGPKVLPKNLLAEKINAKFAAYDSTASGLAIAAIGGFTHIPQKRKFKFSLDIRPGMAVFGPVDGLRQYARLDLSYGIFSKLIVQAYSQTDTLSFTPDDTLANASGLAYEDIRFGIGGKFLLLNNDKLRVVPGLFYALRMTEDMKPEFNLFPHRQVKPELAVDFTPRPKFLLSTNISYGITLAEEVEQIFSYDFPGIGSFDTTITTDVQVGNTFQSDIRATYLLSPIDTRSRVMGIISPNIGIDFIFKHVGSSSFMGEDLEGSAGHTLSVVPLIGLRSIGTGSVSLNFSLGAQIPLSQDGGFPEVTGIVMGLKYRGSFLNVLKKLSRNVSDDEHTY